MSIKQKNGSAEGFISSVLKFSISTFVNFGISGAVLLMTNYLLPDKTLSGELAQFVGVANSIMAMVIFGLDQSFIRFYNEPPGKTSSNSLFRLCFYLSVSVLFAAGLVASLFFSAPLRVKLDFNLVGTEVIPLLFLNAFFWMIARYFLIFFRMQQHILYYTIVNILMGFFFRLFYILAAYFTQNALALMLTSVGGLGVLALFLVLWQRKVLRPRRGDLDREAMKTIIPFGAAVAPTEIMRTLNPAISYVVVATSLSPEARGLYAFSLMLSNIVTSIQGGFSSFWGAYMYANYKTEQKRIIQVHDYLNLLILLFFTFLIAFQDLIFWVLSQYAEAISIFPFMMLAAVFTILCETTVYGITIARKPIFDTIGHALSFVVNIALLYLLIPPFGLVGSAIALAGSNFSMYLFRTLFGQKYYRSLESPVRTATALALAVAITVVGTMLVHSFWLRLAACAVTALLYCLLYLSQLKTLIRMAFSIVNNLLSKNKL